MTPHRGRTKICNFWRANGSCKFGDKCRFAHGQNDSRPPPKLDPIQEWRLKFPRPGTLPRPTDLAKLFQDGLALVSGENHAIMQDTILTLASDPGLVRIRELIESFDTAANRTAFVTEKILPFFQTILHPNVEASPLLENDIVKIYNLICGPGGQRAIQLFDLLSHVHQNLDRSQKTSKAQFQIIFEVFVQVMLRNGAAHLAPQLVSIAGSLIDQALEICYVLPNAETHELRRFAEKLNRHLQMGKEIPVIETKVSKSQSEKAKFVQEQQPPGGRHDNDHDDIRKIQVLPTYNEIESLSEEYLPAQGQQIAGLAGFDALIDRHFRLLREDTVGQLRDAIRVSLHRPENGRNGRSGKSGIRTNTYSNLHVVDVCFLRGSGLEIFVRVDQPSAIQNATRRKEWWTRTKRLQNDALVCIANLGTSHVYCTVSTQGRPSQRPMGDRTPSEHHSQTERLQRYNGMDIHSREGAYLTLKPIDASSDSLFKLLSPGQGARDAILVEFPGVLLPAFRPTLLALQQLLNTRDMPLTDVITSQSGTTVTLGIPAYARAPDFIYDLGCLTDSKASLHFCPSRQFDVKALTARTTLDEPQAKALIHCLTTSLSLIQGPPGTGKSYTGVALIKVLLAAKEKANLGPVVCVCYTNHALDQLLESLHKDGIKQIVRIGSRSKSEILENVNLRVISRQAEQTRAEKHSKWELNVQYANDVDQASQLLDKLAKAHYTRHVKEFLQTHNQSHHSQLFGGTEIDGWQKVVSKDSDPLRKWVAQGSSPPHDTPRSIEDLELVNLGQTTSAERARLLQYWIGEIREEAIDNVLTIADSYQKTDQAYKAVRGGIDLRCLENADVVGLTTTGLAQNLDILRKLRAKVLVCEEAGEVLEAHVLTALLPKLEHVILIGDHQQLRPQVQNYELSRENPRGAKYSLDVSLFERLVSDPQGLQSAVPYRTLEIQRRMHPSISQLIRQTLYPALQDASNVSNYPEIAGMKHRLFWFDHRYPEDQADDEHGGSTSHSNAFEVSMVTALVLHLVRQGVYQPNEIAVLTPYLSQLFHLRAALSKVMTVAVGERDLDQAERQGFKLEDEHEISGKLGKSTKASLLQSMRVATVDNFQGEEAKVVVISLVRSNEQNRVGFLRTSNRINVLLSRAQHGMYIVGNSNTAATVPMWEQVIRMLDATNFIGPQLELQCERHVERPIAVSNAEDFVIMSPEGGCGTLCDRRLLCGHPCRNKCHSSLLHNAVHCLEPCPRSLEGCDHSCPRNCGDTCVEKCGVILTDETLLLLCGHILENPTCWQKQHPDKISCMQTIAKTVPGCEHVVQVKCCIDVTAPKYNCDALCNTDLSCGHECKKSCYKCQPRVAGDLQDIPDHGKCQQVCGRQYNSCSHSCQSACHGGACPPCKEDCTIACVHSKCDKKCSEPCTPCASDVCQSQCPHSRCTMPCAAPCDWIPCGERCPKELECGHQCPSLCGEICPSPEFCQTCATDAVKEQIVDMIEMGSYAEVDLDQEACLVPPCGHILTMTTMDGMVGMAGFYDMDEEGRITGVKGQDLDVSQKVPVCPQCRGSLRNINRYGRIVREVLLYEATKKFVSWANATYVPLAQHTQLLQEKLLDTTDDSARQFNVLPAKRVDLHGDTTQQVRAIKKASEGKRYDAVISAHRKINNFACSVAMEEQPFRRVWDLVQNKRRRHGTEIRSLFQLDSSILQTRQHMLATSLLIRCHLAILSDFISHIKLTTSSRVDLSENRKKCEELAEAAATGSQPTTQVEAHLYYGRYCAVEQFFLSQKTMKMSSVTDSDSDGIETEDGEDYARQEAYTQLDLLKEQGMSHVEQARILHKDYPGSTAHLANELDQVENMVTQSVVNDVILPQEMKAIYEAMSREFGGTGHWYRCANGHLFTIGECGRAMQRTSCPQCGAPVGGQNHRAAEGVTAASDLERQMQAMRM